MSTSTEARYGARRQPRGWRQFLTPKWVVSLVLVVGFSALALSVLAPWQLGKNDQIVERNARIEAASETDPVPISELLDGGGFDADDEWRRVTLSGSFLPEDEAVLRLRPVNGNPAVQALTPFELDGGETILVNRGYLPTAGSDIPSIEPAPPGRTELLAVARKNEPRPETPARVGEKTAGSVEVTGINTGQIAEATGLELADDYVQLSEEQPAALNPVPIPQLNRGSHLSYGFQWIAFGIMAPLGLGYLAYAEIRERRRVKNEGRELDEAAGGPDGERTGRGGRLGGALGRRRAPKPWEDDELAAADAGGSRDTLEERYGAARGGALAAEGRRARREEDRF